MGGMGMGGMGMNMGMGGMGTNMGGGMGMGGYNAPMWGNNPNNNGW